MTTVSTYCMTQSRPIPSIQPAGRKTTRQILALSRAMMNIIPYQRHAPLNHISRAASTDPALLRSAWTYQHSRRCRNLAGISGKQTALSLQRASLKVSIAYHRGVKTTNASANLSSPRKIVIPCRTNESEALFEQYKENGDPDTGTKLMTSLKERRCKRWSEEMAALDFTHSSRRSWRLLRKLGGATHSKRQQSNLTANEVAHQLLLNGSVKKNRKQANHILKQQREALFDCPETSNLSQAFTTYEIINALEATMEGKAAEPDGIFPDMLKNIGPAAIRWLQAFYDDVVTTANIPKIWRSANVIAIRKPGKPLDDSTSYRPISLLCCCYKLLGCQDDATSYRPISLLCCCYTLLGCQDDSTSYRPISLLCCCYKLLDDSTSYRPISLLCCCYKLLERLLLTRLATIFESVIPPEQAGLRKKRNTCDQVLALTSYIESGFQKKLKTGAVMIDLSAAYDTVWQAGLMMKLSKAIKCRTTIRLIASLISQRNCRVFLANQISRKHNVEERSSPRICTCAIVLQLHKNIFVMPITSNYRLIIIINGPSDQ